MVRGAPGRARSRAGWFTAGAVPGQATARPVDLVEEPFPPSGHPSADLRAGQRTAAGRTGARRGGARVCAGCRPQFTGAPVLATTKPSRVRSARRRPPSRCQAPDRLGPSGSPHGKRPERQGWVRGRRPRNFDDALGRDRGGGRGLAGWPGASLGPGFRTRVAARRSGAARGAGSTTAGAAQALRPTPERTVRGASPQIGFPVRADPGHPVELTGDTRHGCKMQPRPSTYWSCPRSPAAAPAVAALRGLVASVAAATESRCIHSRPGA